LKYFIIGYIKNADLIQFIQVSRNRTHASIFITIDMNNLIEHFSFLSFEIFMNYFRAMRLKTIIFE